MRMWTLEVINYDLYDMICPQARHARRPAALTVSSKHLFCCAFRVFFPLSGGRAVRFDRATVPYTEYMCTCYKGTSFI